MPYVLLILKNIIFSGFCYYVVSSDVRVCH